MHIYNIEFISRILSGVMLQVLLICGFGVFSKIYMSIDCPTPNSTPPITMAKWLNKYATGVARMALATIMDE